MGDIVDIKEVKKTLMAREALPGRRLNFTQKVRIGRDSLYFCASEYEDVRIGEIFLNTNTGDASFKSLLNCWAIAISIGLQYGVPPHEYTDAFINTRFEPSGIIQGHKNIKMCSSMVDYIAREIEITYLGRDDLAHVKPEGQVLREESKGYLVFNQKESEKNGEDTSEKSGNEIQQQIL